MEHRIKSEPDLVISEQSFLCWIHRSFYEHLPDELLEVKSPSGELLDKVVPGKLRHREVQVGKHIPPTAKYLNNFLDRFNQIYSPEGKNDIEKIIISAAAHHRLAWIHPFLDGNGRVIRLFSDAYFFKANIDGYGLWNLSRGLARHKSDYFNYLAMADAPRQGDLDGRGNLSLKGLYNFTEFFLNTVLDQIKFMSKLLELDGMISRIELFCRDQIMMKKIPEDTSKILAEAFIRGELSRGSIAELLGKSERSTRRVISELVKQGLLVSDTPKGAVRLGFTAEVIPYYFPRLYPASVEMELR